MSKYASEDAGSGISIRHMLQDKVEGTGAKSSKAAKVAGEKKSPKGRTSQMDVLQELIDKMSKGLDSDSDTEESEDEQGKGSWARL